ncbi:response regulator [Citricoccus nitrophenolicus]|uniref:response regulator n=1 Tax=Citricoccus nitrophenolicus TaxID=863575 RepID=UPI0039B4D6C6
MSKDLRVLIVDDDFHVARLHAEYVRSVPGFQALDPVSTADAALRAVEAHRPDLVLLDVYLPDALGLDLLRTLDTDVFMLTAAAEVDAVRKAYRRGALTYLIKPFSAEQLTQRLQAYARYRRLLLGPQGVDQQAVDRALRGLTPAPNATGTRARQATETAVLKALEAEARVSASEIARTVGVSRATAQRYLSALVDEGVVEIELEYGSTGRPEHLYRLP